MAELARQAKVDVSTVSRALNDSPLVKPDTKAHIIKIAEELGYAINISARNLRKQTSGTIGIVIPLNPESGQTISDPFFLEMVGAVSHAASREGYDLIVSVPKSETEIAEKRLLLTGRADGLIVIGQAGRTHRLKKLDIKQSNIVVWGGQEENSNYTLVGSDNQKGGDLAAEHLLSLDRKRILFVGDTELPEVALRYSGYLKAHKRAGVKVDPSLILRQGFGGETAYQAVKSFSEAGHEFDAIFAASDVLAMAAIQAVQSYGKTVPKDIAVVGYDNVGYAAMSTPALTTIDQNIAQGGDMLVQRLLDKINGKPTSSAFTTTKLVIRRSCGA